MTTNDFDDAWHKDQDAWQGAVASVLQDMDTLLQMNETFSFLLMIIRSQVHVGTKLHNPRLLAHDRTRISTLIEGLHSLVASLNDGSVLPLAARGWEQHPLPHRLGEEQWGPEDHLTVEEVRNAFYSRPERDVLEALEASNAHLL